MADRLKIGGNKEQITAYIYYKLQNAGYSDIAIEGILTNLYYESDGFKATEEYQKNNKGTKGLGIAQWTGPRRKEFESYLEENGLEADDIEANIDFLIKDIESGKNNTNGFSKESINNAKSVEEATSMFLKGFERPQDQSDAHVQKRIDKINIPSVNKVIEDARQGKVVVAGQEPTEDTSEGDLEAAKQELEKELEKEKVKSNPEAEANIKAKLKSVKDQIKKEADTLDKDAFDKQFAEFNDSFSSPEKIKDSGFVYDKGDFAPNVPIDAIAQGALGLIGLSSTDVEIPKDETKVSQATLAYLNETKRLSKLGLPPEMEAKAKADLKESTKVGIENLTRASGGNRNLILANLGGLDTAKAKGISALHIADAQAKDAAFAQYAETLRHIDQFEQSKQRYNLRIDDREAQRQRQQGENLANSAFAQMMDDFQYQRENGPGSANDMFKKQIEFEMFGQVNGMKDDGSGTVKGTASYKEAQDREVAKFNSQVQATVEERDRFKGMINTMTPDEKIALQRGGFNPSTVNTKDFKSKEDLLMNFVDTYEPPAGFVPVDPEFVDKDTFKDESGQKHRMTGFGNQSFDAREWWDKGGTGLDWRDAYADNEFVMKTIGSDVHSRNVSELGVKADGRTYDTAFLQNRFDPVKFTDIGGPLTLEQIIQSNQNPFLDNQKNK